LDHLVSGGHQRFRDGKARATEIGSALANAVREHSKYFLAEGIILVLLGALAIFLPLFATVTITIILGWIFLASGIVRLIATFGARQAPGFWWSLHPH
jgi:uncharacterized membrane protein HdeD (DUF308 family)